MTGTDLTLRTPARVPAQRIASSRAAYLASVDVLRGATAGTVITDELEADARTVSHTVVVPDHGPPAVLMSWVSTHDVPVRQRIRIGRITERIRRSLDLPAVGIRYLGPPRWLDGAEILVCPVDPEHPTFDSLTPAGMQRVTAGLTSPLVPWTICLRADLLSGDHLERTIAHELRHVDQLWGRAGGIPDSERERDAAAFADQWMETR